ncbi:MAG TPA: DUF2938 domain-containing protein [Burkholderiales bacterium]|nr:DUF2938 domain-containing protein [Burkholderiales bacterium]
MDTFVNATLIGTGATAVMDLWGVVRQRAFGIPNANYGLVGRWIAWMPRGRFRHERIAATPAVKGEKAIGWAAHYAIGIAFAGLLVVLQGPQPTLASALMVGIGTVAAPFLLMQPGMGAGIAASRTPRPNAARLQSLVTHAVFGFGLYAAALFLNFVKG